MELTLPPRILFYWRTLQIRLGWMGLLGVFLLVLAIVLYFALTLPQVIALRSLDAENTQRQTRSVILKPTPVSEDAGNPDTYFQSFPDAINKEAALKTILDLADKHQLSVDSGKYEVHSKENRKLVLYEVSFPLMGTYPQIKSFVADTLNALPNAALSQIHLHRVSPEINDVEAELLLTLYYRNGSS